MRGYGRDYDDRGWFERAEDTVRGWFGGGPQYDRDYSASRPRGEWNRGMNAGGTWSRGPDRGEDYGYQTNNWNNQHASYDSVRRAAGGYYGADYDRPDRYGSMGMGMDYDRDYGYNRGRMGGMGGSMSGGMGRDMSGGMSGGSYGGMGGGMGRGMRGGMSGGMGGGSYGGMRDRGTPRDTDRWMGSEYGGGGIGNTSEWGDYGGYGGQRWRNSTSGGVEPGRHFRGYGHGSTSGSGYEPY